MPHSARISLEVLLMAEYHPVFTETLYTGIVELKLLVNMPLVPLRILAVVPV